MGVTVRSATSADLPGILDLVRHVLATLSADSTAIQLYLENVKKNEIWAVAHPGSCTHLVAALEGRLIGVVLIKEHWNLCNLFVHPSQQNQGVGNLLLKSAIEDARIAEPHRPIELYSVQAATGFYQRAGFVLTGVKRADALHMMLMSGTTKD